MLRSCFVSLAMMVFTLAYGQRPSITTRLGAVTGTAPGSGMMLDDVNGRPFVTGAAEEIEGSPFLYEEWRRGNVLFGNARLAYQVRLKFSVYSHQVFFERNGQMMAFMEEVKEFSIGKDSAQKQDAQLFRRGYPAIDEQTEKSFYEVLAGDSIQLLKARVRKVEEFQNYNESKKRRFAEITILYVFIPSANSMIKIKKDKKSLQAALPALSGKIEQIIKQYELRIKDEADLIRLIEGLGN